METREYLNDYDRYAANSSQPTTTTSAEKKMQNFGGEMLTWAPEGVAIGMTLGLIAGFLIYIFIAQQVIQIPALDPIRIRMPFTFFMIVMAVHGILGAFAGTVVGIGTPKFNPHPQQGNVKDWKTFVLRKKHAQKDKYVFVPVFKSKKM